MIRSLLLLAALGLCGCAATDEYRENSFSPKRGPECGPGRFAVCDMHMGKPVRCECVTESPFGRDEDFDQ